MADVPATMTAIEISRPGGPEMLKPVSRPVPRPAEGEVLIKVAAAGVNRPDVLQRQGNYPVPPGASDIPGLEVAGEIVALGAKAAGWKVGDRCMALLAGGGYAEYAAAPVPQCLRLPKGYSLVEAAAVPETFYTVWTNVFERGALKAGESFLVHGGASGIGTTAIQLAKAFGARVFATAGTAAKARTCERLGAERGIDYSAEDFVPVVMELTKGRGVDVILDMVGGDYAARNIAAAAVEGRLVSIAFLRGAAVEINLAPIMMKRLILTGSTLRPRTVAQKGEITAALAEKVLPLMDAGRVRPVVEATLPLAEAAEAHRRIDADHTGKIILTTAA
ncbi:MAG TPA: NAD(P)H-quinone oxidoreductase [Candidatus Sulfotelmatobacter sp.]|nr:NAD(P)H-quinone oxidoreductase [Candidatus Sulfotelmatobacter sp.]